MYNLVQVSLQMLAAPLRIYFNNSGIAEISVLLQHISLLVNCLLSSTVNKLMVFYWAIGQVFRLFIYFTNCVCSHRNVALRYCRCLLLINKSVNSLYLLIVDCIQAIFQSYSEF